MTLSNPRGKLFASSLVVLVCLAALVVAFSDPRPRALNLLASASERGEEYCDAATKTHINNDPAQYYDYPLSSLFFYQVHETIATKILKQDPHNTNYWGHPEVGKFLADLMRPGATRNWRELLKEKTGKDLSAEAMVKYYSPLMEYLKKQNRGRKHTLPQL